MTNIGRIFPAWICQQSCFCKQQLRSVSLRSINSTEWFLKIASGVNQQEYMVSTVARRNH